MRKGAGYANNVAIQLADKMFEIKVRDGLARIGVLHTKHGKILTPTLLPVINPHIDLLPVSEIPMADAIITNSYIIYSDENLRKEAVEKGLHSLLNFKKPIMTDSGSFQIYKYGIEIDPIEIVKFQREIGSDIGTILDLFSERKDYEIVKKETEETIRRAKESIKEKGEMLLACTVQGGIYKELRRKCSKEMAKLRADIYPIGGVVPLMENQEYKKLAEIIIECKKNLPPSRPIHLFGAGHPLIFPLAVALGCDIFDSASYVKYAKDNRFIFPDGTKKLDEIDEIPCNCKICDSYSADEMRKMDRREREKKIAQHNLLQAFGKIKKIREAIKHGYLMEIVERGAVCHPNLMEAMEIIKNNKRWLEKYENISKDKAFIYSGKYSIHRPIVYRLQKRIIERYEPFFEKSIIFDEMQKPYTSKNEWLKKIEGNVFIDSPFGLIPIELDEIYPVAQSVFPEILDDETRKESSKIWRKFKKLEYAGYEEFGKNSKNFDLRKIRAIADYQFGKGAGNALFKGKIELIKSKKTGKIRNVICDGKHLVSMRATDGFFTLKKEGAKILHKYFKPPKMRVYIGKEAISFVKEGKNVFAKFVLDACKELRPYDEALIVSENDELIAVGQCVLNREEMTDFERGIAVITREVV
ncbi:MAG: tRNA guanosine(15) transglycosylase TgtA [Thermoplasmatales archaeon]|nr:tRNA guanosine(15) transglycosylase TgtA [Thermoplasmatales archaeon]